MPTLGAKSSCFFSLTITSLGNIHMYLILSTNLGHSNAYVCIYIVISTEVLIA